MTIYSLECKNCGKIFQVKDHSKQKFCTVRCGVQYRGRNNKEFNVENKVKMDKRYDIPFVIITKKESVKKFYENIYKNSKLYLERKQDIFFQHYSIPRIFE